MENAERFYGAFQRFSDAIDDGRNVCSAFLYNEYLAEERDESFGEFIARETSELHERLWGYRWRYHGLTESILQAHATTERPPFLYYANLKSEPIAALYTPLRKRLEKLHRAEMELIFDPKNSFPSVSVDRAPQLLDDLLEKYRGEHKPLASHFAVESALFKLFARTVLESNLTESTNIALMSEKAATLIPKVTQQLTYDTVEKQDSGMFTTNEFLEFIENLKPLAGELGVRRLVTLLKLVHFPKLFGRGSTAELRKILLQFASEEEALGALKVVIDMALSHDNAMPTVNQWKSALGSDLLAMGSWELLLAFMGAENARKSYHLSKDQILFRRTYGAQ